MKKIILVAGATGNLGGRVVKSLLTKDAEVRILARENSSIEKLDELKNLGAIVYKINHWTTEEISEACQGVTCVVSCLAGLREVVIDSQKVLLDAAILANVPRFIPSDYSLDFTKFSAGENRNLDLRREFHTYLDQTKIAATTIFNGAFMDMLTNEMPLILFKQKAIIYWGNKDRKWDFTTMDNTAEFTACVALSNVTPRYLHIAGDEISPNRVRTIMQEITGKKHKLIRTGGQSLLGLIIKIAKKFSSAENELYPAWQGMQYMHNMIDDRSVMSKNDNNMFPAIKWTTAKELLSNYIGNQK